MKRLLDWIKTHTGATILICALFFVVPLVTVHITYKSLSFAIGKRTIWKKQVIASDLYL